MTEHRFTDFDGLQKQLQALVAGGPPGVIVTIDEPDRQMTLTAGARMLGGPKLTEEARFPLGCIIKPLIALVCSEFHARGAFDADRPVDELLPDLRSPHRRDSCPSVRQLLAHTGGYVEPGMDDRWTLTWERFAALFRERQQIAEPGSIWSYAQSGYAIVGRVIELISGREPLELVEEMLLAPLAVELQRPVRGGRSDDVTPHVFSARRQRFDAIRLPRETEFFRHSISDLTLTSAELATVAAAIGGPRLPANISDPAYRLFSAPAVVIPATSGGLEREAVPRAFGCGLAGYRNAVGHNGSLVGTTCALRFQPAAKVAVAVAMNAWAPGLRDQLAARLISLICHTAPQRAAVSHVTVPLSRFEGAYRGLSMGSGDIKLTLANEKLWLEGLGQGFHALAASLSVGADSGIVIADSTSPWMSVALAIDQVSERTYIMIGPNAYVPI